MKTKLLATVVFVGAAMASQFAAASDGTITFTGSVIDQTCIINGGAPSFGVGLAPVSTGTLNASVGATGNRTGFSIKLTGCSRNTPARTNFEPGPTVDADSGQLILTPGVGVATNVRLQLLNSDLSVIKVGADPLTTQNTKPINIVAGAGQLNHYVEYISTAAGVTPGTANSSVTYTMVYQ